MNEPFNTKARKREVETAGGDREFASPAWHAKELAATEQRLAEGREQVLDWEAAKQSLENWPTDIQQSET